MCKNVFSWSPVSSLHTTTGALLTWCHHAACWGIGATNFILHCGRNRCLMWNPLVTSPLVTGLRWYAKGPQNSTMESLQLSLQFYRQSHGSSLRVGSNSVIKLAWPKLREIYVYNCLSAPFFPLIHSQGCLQTHLHYCPLLWTATVMMPFLRSCQLESPHSHLTSKTTLSSSLYVSLSCSHSPWSLASSFWGHPSSFFQKMYLLVTVAVEGGLAWYLKSLEIHNKNKNKTRGTSLVAQWLRICLPKQGTRIQALVQEDPTCHRATKPVCHNYWACALEPAIHICWAHESQLLKPVCLEPVLCNKRSHHNEKPTHLNEEEPLLAATRESLRAATKTQHSQKINN